VDQGLRARLASYPSSGWVSFSLRASATVGALFYGDRPMPFDRA
jgi:hypothetical protein